ncbi:hypothetical protein ACX27_02820 [Nostoc piscinale CENA21]|uniref:Uncharacterized protein n=1 Tax=Nostoc piscinale CENA21 TaxID=224013 RepID=A0A0M5MHP9_9NOSO|nr:hypothetical protein [Nostoc piscinale]ALF52025.1 hypothetical protein ACX27_02820 [Nostoc piscinale CENA21]
MTDNFEKSRDEKIDKIIAHLNHLESQIKPKESKFSKVVETVEKLMIPIALGVLAFITSQAANQISQAQLELAQSQSASQDAEFKDNLQVKYIEIFYRDMSSTDKTKKKSALSLLTLMKPEIAKPLLDWAKLNIPEELQGDAKSVAKNINNEIVNILGKYMINIYYINNDSSLSNVAQNIKDALTKYGLKADRIVLNNKGEDFFRALGYPTAYEIRYDPGSEDNAAELLTKVLQENYSASKPFIKRPIGSGTKNSISIFLSK